MVFTSDKFTTIQIKQIANMLAASTPLIHKPETELTDHSIGRLDAWVRTVNIVAIDLGLRDSVLQSFLERCISSNLRCNRCTLYIDGDRVEWHDQPWDLGTPQVRKTT